MDIVLVSLSALRASLITWRLTDVARAYRQRPAPASTRIL
jgi:hypothetical protein